MKAIRPEHQAGSDRAVCRGSFDRSTGQMIPRMYARWMYGWETALTTRDENRVERPLEWGFEHLRGVWGAESAARVERGEATPLEAMVELNERLVREADTCFHYDTPVDFRLEERHPELFPTNVRPETLAEEREYRRRAEAGQLRRAPYLRFTSAVGTGYPENDVVNARWYEAAPRIKDGQTGPRQAMIVLPQWNADAVSHNALCNIFLQFGVSSLRLSKPYHDIRRPAELERSDYAVSANVGRTINAARQAVADIRSCCDWLEAQGYEQIGILGTSLGSCYAFLAAAMDPRIRVCAFNHASMSFGDVVWEGQSTRHVQSALEHAGLTQEDARRIFAAMGPSRFMDRFAATAKQSRRQTLMVHATYDLSFPPAGSLEVLKGMDEHGIAHVSKVLPCGHYTTGETPYKYIDGWYLVSFVWRAFRDLRRAG
jgi:dienelactone hydrolase